MWGQIMRDVYDHLKARAGAWYHVHELSIALVVGGFAFGMFAVAILR